MVADAEENDDDDDGDDGDDDTVALPLFAVDADTGVVTAVASLDRETSPQHRFQVRLVVYFSIYIYSLLSYW